MTNEPPAGWRLAKASGDGHVFCKDNARNGQTRKAPKPIADLTPDARRCMDALTPELAAELANDLGVPDCLLRELRVGWDASRAAWTFPERNAANVVVGIIYRYLDGSKVAGKGHKRGLTIPANLAHRPDPVLIVEGASDVLAAEAMGFAAVGRPACRGGVEQLAKLLKGRDVLVVGENDEKGDGAWPGRDGAQAVAADLAGLWGTPVRWTLPKGGHKDLRTWYLNDEHDGADDIMRRLQDNAQEADAPDTSPARLQIDAYSEIKEETMVWLWPNRIPLGKLTVIAGQGGLGKSFITLDIATRVSNGTTWPDGVRCQVNGETILFSAEDGRGDTIKPRLRQMGGDQSKIFGFKAVWNADGTGRLFNVQHDREMLEAFIRGRDGKVRVVVLDPLNAYLGGGDGCNIYKDNDVRAALAPMVDLAQEHQIAIIAIMHFNKAAADDAIFRVMGSTAFTNLSRTTLLVGKDPDDADGRLLLPGKMNVGKPAPSLKFKIVGPNPGVLEWGGETTTTAREAFAPADNQPGPKPDKLNAAIAWLKAQFAPASVNCLSPVDLRRDADAAGINYSTLKAARKELGLESWKEKTYGGRWLWGWDRP